jgi:hypothetical protein
LHLYDYLYYILKNICIFATYGTRYFFIWGENDR